MINLDRKLKNCELLKMYYFNVTYLNINLNINTVYYVYYAYI